MKKIFFLIAFALIGTQAYSQIYMVVVEEAEVNGCDNSLHSYSEEVTIRTIAPSGVETLTCINKYSESGGLAQLNTILNNIINTGYSLISPTVIPTLPNNNVTSTNSVYFVPSGTIFILASPWSTSGLEEVPQTLKKLNIYPNPADDFIDIVLDYDIKSSTEIVVYSEAGYIYHKEKVSNLNKNEPYRLDISKVPAGKYFITIVNEKSYTTAQKLIIV